MEKYNVKIVEMFTENKELFESEVFKGLNSDEKKLMKLIWLCNHTLQYDNPIVEYKLFSEILGKTPDDIKEIFAELNRKGVIDFI